MAASETACTTAHVKLTLLVGAILAVLVVAVAGWVNSSINDKFNDLEVSIDKVALSVDRSVDQRIEADNRLTDALVALELRMIDR